MNAQQRYEQFRATLPPRLKTWGEIGLSDKPIRTHPIPYGRPIGKGGWHRDKATGRRMK